VSPGAGLIKCIPAACSGQDADVEWAQGQKTGRIGLEENKSISIAFYFFNFLAGFIKTVKAIQKTLVLAFPSGRILAERMG
jgi:hypothetical protein